jgi:hypothetical protein
MRFRLGTASLLFALSLSPAVSAAEVSDADRATARSLAGEGQEALDRKDFAAALDRFGRADAIIHAPTLQLGVARAQVGLGNWIAAQESYNRILREGAPQGSPAPFFAAIEDARRELDALSPRIPQVLITVKGTDAPEVTIDGAPVPRVALGVKRPVDPGVRLIRATAAGLTAVEAKVTLAESTSETVSLELKPVAQEPLAPVAQPAGGSGSSDAGGEGVSGDGTRKTLTLVAFGVGGVGLAVGAVTGLLAVGKHSDLEEACPSGSCAAGLQGDLDSYRTMGTLSTIGFIAGGVGVGAGAFLFFTAPSSPQRAEISVTPVIGLGYAGARGRF